MLKLVKPTALTAREKEILEWSSGGMSNKEIARILNIAPATVSKHLHNIYVKTNTKNRIRAYISTQHGLNGEKVISSNELNEQLKAAE